MDKIQMPFRFDPRPVVLDPRAYIPVPGAAEILAEAEQLAAEVLGRFEAQLLAAELGLDPAEPTAIVVEFDSQNADGPRV